MQLTQTVVWDDRGIADAVQGRLNQGPRIFFLFEGPSTVCGEIIF